MKQCCIILTTTDKQDVADTLAAKLIESGLAACVQIDDINSIFNWGGKVDKCKEYRLSIKTLSENYKQIERMITTNHNYELPQVVKIDITGGLTEYLKWVIENSTIQVR